jgi:hypothetical protein
MATKTAVTDPADWSADELERKITEVDLRLEHAASADQTAGLELEMSRGRSVLGDSSRLEAAEARKRATEASVNEWSANRKSLVGWEAAARLKALLGQLHEKLAKIAAEKATSAAEAIALPALWTEIRQKTDEFDRRDREQQQRLNFLSWAGTSTIEAQIEKHEQEHRAELEAIGVLGRR